MIKVKYAVTFEFDEAAPITIRGEVEAIKPGRLALRAIEDAKKQAPKKLHWSSICILLDRSDYAFRDSKPE